MSEMHNGRDKRFHSGRPTWLSPQIDAVTGMLEWPSASPPRRYTLGEFQHLLWRLVAAHNRQRARQHEARAARRLTR